MTNQHPITPPPELVQQWRTEGHHQDYCTTIEHVAARAAHWGADRQLELDAKQIGEAYQAGADAELETCCEWLEDWVGNDSYAKPLRAARRPRFADPTQENADVQ